MWSPKLNFQPHFILTNFAGVTKRVFAKTSQDILVPWQTLLRVFTWCQCQYYANLKSLTFMSQFSHATNHTIFYIICIIYEMICIVFSYLQTPASYKRTHSGMAASWVRTLRTLCWRSRRGSCRWWAVARARRRGAPPTQQTTRCPPAWSSPATGRMLS